MQFDYNQTTGTWSAVEEIGGRAFLWSITVDSGGMFRVDVMQFNNPPGETIEQLPTLKEAIAASERNRLRRLVDRKAKELTLWLWYGGVSEDRISDGAGEQLAALIVESKVVYEEVRAKARPRVPMPERAPLFSPLNYWHELPDDQKPIEPPAIASAKPDTAGRVPMLQGTEALYYEWQRAPLNSDLGRVLDALVQMVEASQRMVRPAKR